MTPHSFKSTYVHMNAPEAMQEITELTTLNLNRLHAILRSCYIYMYIAMS